MVDYHLKNDKDGKNRRIFDDSLTIRITISSGYGDFGVASLVDFESFREKNLFSILLSFSPISQKEKSTLELRNMSPKL